MNLQKARRLQLSLTRLGLYFLVAMLLMGVFAVNTGNNLIYLIFSIMLGFFLVSGWISRQAIRDLEVQGIEAGNLFAGVQGSVRVRLKDNAPRRIRGLQVQIELGGTKVETGFLPGGAGGSGELVLALQAHPGMRGPCRLTGLRLRTSYPFGLMEKGWRFELAQEVLVLPHPRKRQAREGHAGDHTEVRPREGVGGPDGARPFRERDPLSRIHWKRTAQRGEPWVRTFEDEEPVGMHLRLDLEKWVAGALFERELEGLSGDILQARLGRREVFLTLSGARDRKEFRGFSECWRALALAQAPGGPVHG